MTILTGCAPGDKLTISSPWLLPVTPWHQAASNCTVLTGKLATQFAARNHQPIGGQYGARTTDSVACVQQQKQHINSNFLQLIRLQADIWRNR